jgi:hypothetical protein
VSWSSDWSASQSLASVPRNTTKPLDLPRNLARFCYGLQRFAILRHFGVSHEIIGPLIRFHVCRGSQFGTKRGDFVQPSAGKGESLLVVEKVDPIRIFANVGEMDAVWIRDGDVAIIRPQSLQGQQFKGTVTRRSSALQPQNRTLHTEIDLPNGEGKLLPGMYVNVTIIAEHKNVWTLPIQAVAIEADQAFCCCWENGKSVRTPSRLGLTGDELVEVVKKGTSAAQPGEEDHWADFTGGELVVAKAASPSDGPIEKTATNVK